MKTQNNVQKTVSGQVRRLVLVVSAVLFSLAIIPTIISAQDFRKQFPANSNYSQTGMMMDAQPLETEKVDAIIEAINLEIFEKLNHTSTINYEPLERRNNAWVTDKSSFISNRNFTKEENIEAKGMKDYKHLNNEVKEYNNGTETPEIEAWIAGNNFRGF